jgi:peptidoglycan DL-endopeptidase CwlO
MRKFAVFLIVVILSSVLLGLGALMVLISGTTGQQIGGPGCDAGPTDAGATGQQDAAMLSPSQVAVVQRIIDVGKRRNLPPRAWEIAIQAGMTESHLTNLPGGDLDSLGIFQMRPSAGWGTPAQLTDVDYEINKFYDRLLSNVPGWDQLRPGEAAQAVEQSAFPLRYNRWESMAADLVTTDGNVQGVNGCDDLASATQLSQKAINYALAQIGKPYVWGAAGPDAFDCSGLVQQAWKAAGVNIPKFTQTQYEQGGQQIPLSQAQPGDLIFWGYGRNPQATHHVALYLGNNEIVQAPQPGQTVERTKLFDGGELLPIAVRPVPNSAAQVAVPSGPATGGVPGVGPASDNVPAAGRSGAP